MTCTAQLEAPRRIYLCGCGRVHVETDHHRATLSPEALAAAMRARGLSEEAIERLSAAITAARDLDGPEGAATPP